MSNSNPKKKIRQQPKAGTRKAARSVSSSANSEKNSSKKSPSTDTPNDLEHRVLKNCPEGIVAVDSRGLVRYVNAAAEKLLRKKASSLVNRTFSLPFDTSRTQEVSLPGGGRDVSVAEILAKETRLGREKIFIVSLHEVTDRVRREEQLRALSDLDPLTGLLNRRGFLKAAERQLSLAVREKWGMTLLFVDLDGLKYINDSLGHIEGDQALIQTASILQTTIRQPDIIGRYAGDEFAILAFEVQKKSASGERISSRIRKKVDFYNSGKPAGRYLSLSIGLAYFDPESPVTIEELIDVADLKMYEEKRAKRGAR